MPTPKLITITSWSYSRLSTYQQCPRRAKYLYVDKLKEPDEKAPALVNGSRVHALAAVHTTRQLPKWDRDSLPFKAELTAALKSKALPKELECFAEEFRALQKANAHCEDQWTLDRDWNPLGPDGWFSPKAWLRIKVDVWYLETSGPKRAQVTTLHIRDHKTGKMSEDHALQRSLYALGGLIMFPDVKKVTAAHWYLDKGIEEKEEWDAGQLGALKEEWTRRTTAMLNDTTFAPTPSDKCKWCHFRHANKANGGGQCEY